MSNANELYHGYIYLTTNLINNKKYIDLHRGAYDPNYHMPPIVARLAVNL